MGKRKIKRPRGGSEWAAARRAHLAEIRQELAKERFTVMNVLGATLPDSFQFTIGLTDWGLPELVVYALHPGAGVPLLTQAVKGVSALDGAVRAGTRFGVPTVDGSEAIPARLRQPTEHERLHKHPGWAHEYYGRRVDWLMLEAEGWPCPACTPCDKTQLAACTCTFYCWWMYCKLYNGDAPTPNCTT